LKPDSFGELSVQLRSIWVKEAADADKPLGVGGTRELFAFTLPSVATLPLKDPLESTVFSIRALISILVRDELCALMSAARPETCGAAIDVPCRY